jgi:hypothetical protein
MTDDDIQMVVDRELALLSLPVRRSPQRLDELLDPDFREIGASGQLWTRAATIAALISDHPDSETALDVTEMAAEPLTGDLIQVMYVSSRQGKRARRSSLWRRSAGAWRVIFHQGTPISDR